MTSIFIRVMACLFILSGCSAVSIPQNSVIAIWDFEDLTCGEGAVPHLGPILTSKVIEQIKMDGIYTVVERQNLEMILAEHHIGASQMADETTRLRMGRLLGAKWMVFGAFQNAGKAIRLDTRLVNVETGRIVRTSEGLFSGTDFGSFKNAVRIVTELF